MSDLLHRRQVVRFLKFAIPIGIFAWLLLDLQQKQPDALFDFWNRPKQYSWLVSSLGCLILAVLCTFLRWHLLIRGLDIAFPFGGAVRLGLLSYLFNFIGPGAVGGDVVKAFFVAKDAPRKRVEAVGTVVLDRAVGLYTVLVLASLAMLLHDMSRTPELASFLRLIPWLTLAGGAVIIVILGLPRFATAGLLAFRAVPLVGPALVRSANAISLYRSRPAWLLAVALLSIIAHLLVACSLHFADRGLYLTGPTFGEHLLISPLATAAGGLPVPGGLGTFELAVSYTYDRIPEQETQPGQGLAVALCYRMFTILIAAAGGIVYWRNRSQVSSAVDQVQDSPGPDGVEGVDRPVESDARQEVIAKSPDS